MKKRVFSCLLALVLLLSVSVGALAAPELTVDGDGRLTGGAEGDGRLVVASYDPETGRFLGLKQSGENVGGADVLLKAMETNEDYIPLNESRSVLVISEPGKRYTGGSYDAVVVTGAVGDGAVTLQNAEIGDLILCGGGNVTLDGVTVSGSLEVRQEGAALMDGEETPAGITIRNSSNVGSIRICGTAEDGVYLRTEEGCRVDIVIAEGGGDTIFLEGVYNQVVVDTDVPVVLTGAQVTGVTLRAENASVRLEEETRVSGMQISSAAAGATLEAGEETQVASLDSRAENVTVSGGGKIVSAQVSGSGTAYNVTGTVLTVEEGTGAVTQNGRTVNGGETVITGAQSGGTEPQDPEGHVHTWTSTVIAEPAAGSDGEVEFTCAECGITRRGTISYLPYRLRLEDTDHVYQTLENALAAAAEIWLYDEAENTWQHPTVRLVGQDALAELRLPAGFELDVSGSLFAADETCDFGSADFREPGNFEAGFIQAAGLRLHPQEGSALTLGDLTVCGVGEPDTWLVSTDGDDPEIVLMGGIVPEPEYGLPRLTLLCGYFELQRELPAGIFSVLVTENLRGWTDAHIRANISVRGILVAMDTALTVEQGGSLTLTDRSVIEGEVAVQGSLTNNGSLTQRAYTVQQDDESLDGRFGVLEVRDGGTMVNNGAMNTECVLFWNGDWEDGRFAEFRVCGDAEFVNAGSFENSGFIYVWQGGRLVNQGTLLNREQLRADACDDIWDVYPGEEPALIATGAVCSIDNSGALVNEGSVQLTGAAMTVSGVFTNRGSCTVQSVLQMKRTRTLEQREGDPGETDDWQNFVNWAPEGGYWRTASEEYEVYGVFSGSLTVKDGGILDNYAQLQADNALLDLEAGGTLNNRDQLGMDDMGDNLVWWTGDRETAMNGQSLPAPELAVKGVFNNGILTGVGDEFSGTWANTWITGGALRNSGTVVNNGNMDLVDCAYIQSADAAYTNYNTAGFGMVSGSMTVPSGAFFRNEGYMRVTDRYGTDYAPCDLSGFADFFTTWNQDGNDSNWCDVAAEVYDEAGYREAVAAQRARSDNMRYNRLDFCGDVVFTEDATLSDFGWYWVNSRWTDAWHRWDDSLEQWVDCGPEEEGAEWYNLPVGSTLTVAEGVTLTVDMDNTLALDGVSEMMAYFSPCTLKVLGRLVILTGQEGTEENGWDHRECGRVEIWSFGSFVNEGEVVNDGYFEVRYYDMGHGEDSEEEGFLYIHEGRLERPEECVVTGAPENVMPAAEVRCIRGLVNAAAQDSGFRRILIREDTILTLEEDLTVWPEETDIEPGSGLIVPYGTTLTLMDHMWNDGDVSVYGDLAVSASGSLDSNQNLELGKLTGSETARLLVDGYLQIREGSSLTVYPTGSILLRQGSGFDNGGEIVSVELEGAPGFVRRAVLPGMTLTDNCSFRECEFTGALTLLSGEGGRYYGFEDGCVFQDDVTLCWIGGDGELAAEFFDNAWFSEGKRVLVTAEGVEDLRELTERIQIVGACALDIQAEVPCGAGLFTPGSFRLNGVEAGFWGGEYSNGGCSIRFEGEGDEVRRIFQGDSFGEEPLHIWGTLEGFDELRLMQGSFDIQGLDTGDAAIHVNAPFGPTAVELAGHTAHLWGEPDRGADFRVSAGPGSTVYMHNAFLGRDGDDWFGTWLSVAIGEEVFWLNPHIFGAHGTDSIPGVFIGTADERLQYNLTFNGADLNFEAERPVDGEDKTHLWPAGEGVWFTADQGEHPDLCLTVCLPGEVTVIFDPVPVKPED